MGTFREIEGNLLDLFEQGEFDVIIHGCNCFNIMGAGIAKQIADKYPQALKADADFPLLKGTKDRLGNISVSTQNILGKKRYIINLYSQFEPGRNTDYNAIQVALSKINYRFRPERIGLPLLGCGIGGGDWRIVSKIVKKELLHCDVTVVNLK